LLKIINMKDNSQKISAVFDKDLEKVLKGLGLYDQLVAGEIKCVFCGDVVTLSNLEFIFSKNGKIVISCNSNKCKYQMKESISK
jgi:hypothetical protein